MALLPARLPGERLAIKIWETVTERGVGGLLSPWQIRRLGKAHADVHRLEIQTLAQAHRDKIDILAGRKTLDESGQLIDCHPTEVPSVPAATILPKPAPLLERLRQEQDCRELERAINVRATIAMGTLPRDMPKSGVYLFTEQDRHLYVGRSNGLRGRHGRHCRPGATHRQAAFAFQLAREATGRTAVALPGHGQSAEKVREA
jgi:hypothetical protein